MTDSPMARHNAFAAVEAAGKTLPADAIAHIWMPTKSVNDPKVGMGTLVQAGASVVRSSGYYFNTGWACSASSSLVMFCRIVVN